MDATFSVLAIAQLWQVTALIVIVALVNRWLSRKRPHLAHVLWLVVLAKCLTPPLWSSTGGVFCWLQPEQVIESPVTHLDTEWQAVQWQELLVADSAADQWVPAEDSSFAPVPLSDAEAAELLELETASHNVDWPSVLAASWLASVSVVLFVVAVRWWLFWRRLKLAPSRKCPELDEQLAGLARQLGVKRVRLLVTESRIGPAVVGLFRKTILLPAVVVDRLAAPVGRIKLCADPARRGSDVVSTEQLAEQDEGEDCRNGAEPGPAYDSLLPILAHELLHVRRGDLWVGLLQTLAQAVWWFHPLVWWVGRLTNRDAERCCDEEVLAELNCDPATYARSLLDVLELKSQLAPVPVFPGVRPVDVTSKRLERIMTLGQGCRRRTPWWCWLIAIGTAALTLPGAAFVVSAQEEEPKDLTPAEAVPAPLPALQANEQPRPIRQGQKLRAYNVADEESAVTMHVYEITEIAHLLSGSEAEQRQKFERLIRSREQAKDAQINWFDGKPVVRTTNAGHQAVRECIAVFLGSESTSKHLDEFLDSTARQPEAGIVVDLQFVTMNDDSYSKVEDVLSALADREHGPDEFPLIMPAEKWDALHKDIPHDDAWHYLAPQVAVFNGRTVHLESVVQHPPVNVRPASAYRTHGGLLDTPDWLGWKAIALPYQREDGSFWLGMRFVVRSAIGDAEGSSKADVATLPFRRHDHGFRATLREGQVMVLPGLNVNHRAIAEANPSTFLAARIRKLEAATGPNVYPNPRAGNAPRPVSGVGVNSSAGVTGQVQLQNAESNAAQAEPNPVTATKPLELTSRQFGSWKLRLQTNVEAASEKRVILTMADVSDRSVVSATASDIRIRETPRSTTVELMDAKLQLLTSPPQFIVADKLQLISNSTHNVTDPESIRMKATSVTAELLTGDSKSSLKAGQLELMLDPQSFRIVQIRGEKLDSLQQNDLKRANASQALTPVISGNGGDPEEGSWDELKQRRTQQQAELARNTSQALPSPYAPGIEGTLSRKTDASFQEVSLADAMRSLSEQHGLNIVIDIRGLEEEGLTPDTKVSLEVSGISLRSVLKLMLEPLNLGTKIGEDDVIIVTSRERLAGALTACAYAVADLVVPIPQQVSFERVEARRSAEVRAETVGDSASTDAGRGRKQDAAPAPAVTPAPKLNLDKLIELITSTVEPDSWNDRGGSGSIAANETTLSLVVRQTAAVHAEIADLLSQLRRLQDLQVTLEIQTLKVPQSFLASWNVGREFRSLGQSKTQRFMRLSQEQAEQLRQCSDVTQSPKVTLFNGQSCQWKLDGSDSGQPILELQAVVSSDRRFVRLGVNQNDADTNGTGADSTAVISPVPDGDAVLLELGSLAASGAPVVGVPIPGQPKVFRSVPNRRRFVLIQPRIVIVEKEEELLGVEP